MQQVKGRRNHDRMIIEKSAGWEIAIQNNALPIKGNVIEVSKEGFRVCFSVEPSAALSGLAQNQVKAILTKNGKNGCDINFKVLRLVQEPSQVEWILHGQVIDDGAKALIWNLIYEMQEQASAEPSAPEVKQESGLMSRIPERGIYTEEARLKRLEFIEEKTGETFHFARKSQLSANRLVGNIENHLGGIEIPVGLAGPLLFKGKNAIGEIYAPFATSEGALVASASRGALLLSEAGGVTTRTISQRMIRIPMFVMDSLDSAIFFGNWLKNHVTELQDAVAKVSHHAKLTSVDITLTGRVIHASFVYNTGDAAGQNMTTAATWHACQWALSQAKHFVGVSVENFVIDSGLSGDKKVNFKSFVEGRGSRVIAEAFIPADILQKIMKVSVDDLVSYYNSGLSALVQAGAIGSNINVANTIAAMFAATGQDIACVHESSLANFQVEKTQNGIYATMLIPSLIVGTVGGGSALPGQNECLKMLGCSGPNKVARLAEIITGYCLALDLSTMSAICNGTFVKAHERLGRNRPVKWFKQSEINLAFFNGVIGAHLGDEIVVKEAESSYHFDAADSIITELTARNQEKLLGLLPYRLTYSRKDSQGEHKAEVLVKSKPMDQEVMLLACKMAGMCNPTLGELYAKFKLQNESNKCHLKELAIYQQKDPRFTRHVPAVYGVYQDEKREAFVVIMERLADMLLMGNADNPSAWRKDYVESAISGIAEIHSIWYGRDAELKDQSWLGYVQSSKGIAEQKPLLKEMIRHASVEFPQLVTSEVLQRNVDLIENVELWWTELESMKKTLIHNDFNPRNIGIRAVGGAPQLCVFDWELSTIHIPQRDLAELLSFVTTEETTDEEIDGYIELHRATLERLTGQPIDRREWRRGYELALFDLAIGRIAMYLMAHTFKHYSFMEHLLKNNSRLIELERLSHRSIIDGKVG